MSYRSGPEDLQLTDYTSVLKRRWLLIALAALIGTLGGLCYYKVVHKTYTATASVYVTATGATANQVANARTAAPVNLDTEAQVVQSVAVAQAAAKLMHSPEGLQQILGRVKVTVPPNSQVLSISCQARSADAAANCAEAFARAYLNYTNASTVASGSAQLKALQSKINTLESASAKLTIEVASLPSNSSQRASAQEQLNSNHSQLSSLNSQVAQLTTEMADPSGGSIISNATPPQKPTSPRLLLIVPSGLLVGLLIGLVLAFIVDRKDQRIHGPRDVSQLDVPVLMSLPLKGSAPELAIAAPRSGIGREFAELADVVAGSLGAGSHVVLVTGASDGQGAALVAANLAAALARSQPGVILVCANLEGSVIPAMTGLPSRPGLTDTLSGYLSTVEAAQRPASAPRLQVITPGSAAGMGAEDLQRDAVDRLLKSLRGRASWVVVEAPPVTSGPDVYTLAHGADAAILVAEMPRMRRDQLLGRVQQLDRMGTAVLGVALLPSPEASGEPTPEPIPDDNVQLASQAPQTVGNGRTVYGEGAGDARPLDADSPRHEGDETVIINWRAPEEAPSSPRRN